MFQNQRQQWLVLQDNELDKQMVMGGEPAFQEQGVTGIAFSQMVHVLRRHAWKILGVSIGVALLTFIVSKRITPLYDATTMLEISPERTSDLVGPDASRAAWNDADQYLATQLRIVQGDSVLRPVVQEHHLPLDSSRSPDAPIVLKGLQVVRPPNTYLMQITYRSADPVLAAAVANDIAKSYLHHVFHARLDDRKSETDFMEQQLDEVRASMERSAKAVNEFESKLGVVDAQDKTNIVSARLLQLSTEYTAAQADRIRKEAEFIGVKDGSLSAAQQSEQGENLKQLQTSLDQAQQKFVEIGEHFGDRHPEYLKQAAVIAGLKSQLDQAKGVVIQRVGVAFEDAQKREQILQKQLAGEKTSFDQLNATSYRYQALKIEAEENRKLYDDLERRIKESTINSGFQTASTHISDYARPPAKSVFPKVGLNVGVAFGLTLILAIMTAVVIDMSDDSIRTTEQIQSSFQADVLAVIPQCSSTGDFLSLVSDEIEAPATIQAVSIDSGSVQASPGRLQFVRRSEYEEAVRMLWSSFQLASVERAIRSLLITSAMPEEGKTTLTTWMAYVHASHGRRTLLIDADLRRPNAHRYARVPMCPGLADATRGDTSWRSLVVQSGLHSQLDVLPAGALSYRACDDIAQILPHILSEAEGEYDLVLVDGPPLLAFADPLHMASIVDGVMVVVCADKTSRKAVGLLLQTLKRVRANLVGVVLNRVVASSNGYPYSYRNYTDRKNAA